MTIKLNDLLSWNDSLPDQTGEEATTLRALIALREASLRARIAELIVKVSDCENWKLHRCAAVARRIEQTPLTRLEAIHECLLDRSEGRPHLGAAADLIDAAVPAKPAAPAASTALAASKAQQAGALPSVPQSAKAASILTRSATIIDLHGRMRMLENRVCATPGVTGGIQGVRIMRVVAQMSRARAARLANRRSSGVQAVYRHL